MYKGWVYKRWMYKESPRRSRICENNARNQRGVAILLLLALLLIVVTTAYVTTVSLNRQRTQSVLKNAAQLSSAKEYLLGFALNQTPPGLLPCPDNDGDGVADVSGGSCLVQRGFLPFRTLSMASGDDAEGNHLWYAVALSYTEIISGVKLNSSLAPGVAVNGTLPVAAVLLAPGKPLQNQQRSNNDTAAAVAQYLEEQNSDADTTNYVSVNSATNNDELLVLSAAGYWSTVESRVLASAAQSLRDFYSTPGCNQYPWASNGPPYNSNPGNEVGFLPFATATAYGGAAGCSSALVVPAWLSAHWDELLQYSFCGPSGGGCLQLNGDVAQTANALVIAPGVVLAGQSRPSAALTDYYENENGDSDLEFEYRALRNHSGVFNDVVYIVDP